MSKLLKKGKATLCLIKREVIIEQHFVLKLSHWQNRKDSLTFVLPTY